MTPVMEEDLLEPLKESLACSASILQSDYSRAHFTTIVAFIDQKSRNLPSFEKIHFVSQVVSQLRQDEKITNAVAQSVLRHYIPSDFMAILFDGCCNSSCLLKETIDELRTDMSRLQKENNVLKIENRLLNESTEKYVILIQWSQTQR